jgi:hypothetical protein
MSDISAVQLVEFLRGASLHNRSGILLLPPSWLGREPEIAMRLGISYADERERVLQQLTPGQRYLGMGWEDFISKGLEGLASDARPDGDCVLVANADLLLSSFETADRRLFWSFLYERYRPTWGVLLALPGETRRLMMETERSDWTSAGRLSIWEEGGSTL